MSFDLRSLLETDIPETIQSYGPKDCAIYALGVGVGADPFDERQLAYVCPENILALPSMAVILGFKDFWLERIAPTVDLALVLHGEQSVRLGSAPLPSAATVRRKVRVTGVIDKGADKGALILTEETIADTTTGDILAHLTSSIMCRGEGGKGSAGKAAPTPYTIPDRPADRIMPLPSFPQQALLYRLSGDDNPLHTRPAIARDSGFPGPVLHGLATYGMACHSLLHELCASDPARFRSLDVRFTRPVFPGEPLDLQCWIEADGMAAFRVVASARDIVAIDNGHFRFDLTNPDILTQDDERIAG